MFILRKTGKTIKLFICACFIIFNNSKCMRSDTALLLHDKSPPNIKAKYFLITSAKHAPFTMTNTTRKIFHVNTYKAEEIGLSQSVFIDGVEVERVSSYKYLGVHLTDSLTWGDQVDALIKKLNSRLYCLRKMAIFKVRTDVMNMFYNATIYGFWRYCLITWGGNVTKADKERIDGIIRKAGGIIGEPQTTVDSVYD